MENTILISESSTEIRTKLISILNNSFKILTAESEEDIFEKINLNLELSLIIINPKQPHFNGFDFVRRFNTYPQLKHIPIVFIVEDEDEQTQIKGFELGVIDAIFLPLRETVIPHLIKGIINKAVTYQKEEQSIVLTMQNQQQKKLKEISLFNEKIGIFNKLSFVEETSKMLKANPNKKYVLLRWDIDRFKVYNQTFGYKAGDKLLAQIGNIFKETAPDNVTYGHLTADHFVTCAEYTHENQDDVIERITKFLESLNPNFEFIVRLGLYVIKSPDEDISLCCDKALLAQKSIKNTFSQRYAYYDDSMLNDLVKEQELISEMEPALKEHQFIVYLQPQYDYTTQTMTGAEALVRWNHPEKGIISPGFFIPIFERNGFICKLDRYIWEEACILLRKWLDQGLNPVPISVNISRRDIYSQNLVEIFQNLLKKYDLKPELLRLEITESSYMDNPEQLIKVVDDLRNLGFCIEMDDFGSGYSSLNTLKDVPVDILKLDMKFIMSATEGTDSAKLKGGHILSSIVRMANWLKLPVIAEGIETELQADYLKSIGCFYMQGYYFAKPMPIEKYEQLLSELPEIKTQEKPQTELLEISKILDASTQSTMLFNSFVGGAAIIEWTKDKVEALRINDNFLEELDCSREEFLSIQLNLLETLDESNKKTFIQILTEAKRTLKESFCDLEVLPFNKKKESIWLRTRVRYLSQTENSSIYYLAIENISFRMNLLQLNTKLSEQLTTVMETIHEGILSFEYTDKMRLSNCNVHAAKIFGYSVYEFIQELKKDTFALIYKDDKEDFINLFKKIESEEIPSFEFDCRHYCKDGSVIPIIGKGRLIARSNGSKFLNIVIVKAE